MGRWFDVAAVEELPPGSRRVLDAEGIQIAVFNLDGELYAIEDVCTHDGGDLAGGSIECDVIVCPRHGAKFSIKTGEVLAPPAYEDIRTYSVRVEEGRVQVWGDD
jgi:3-phenylpropionate/trans-cinnamate dioxygenase ferredoxin component